MANIVVDNILALIAGKTPPNCVNPQVLVRSTGGRNRLPLPALAGRGRG
jgi:hypothetical protein